MSTEPLGTCEYVPHSLHERDTHYRACVNWRESAQASPVHRQTCRYPQGNCTCGGYAKQFEPKPAGAAQPEASPRPEWFNFIRVYKRQILGTTHQDWIIGFGPRNLCKPDMDEAKAERLCENIKEWLWMWMTQK